MLVHILCISLLFSQCSSLSDQNWNIQDEGSGSDPNSDSLEALTLLSYSGTAANALMKAVGAEMAQEKSSSEKNQALWELKNRADNIWMSIQNKYNFTTDLVFDGSTKQEYNAKVWNPLVRMNKLTSQYIAGQYRITENLFRKQCKTVGKSPLDILNHMRTIFVDHCDYPLKPSIAQVVADYRSFIMQIIRRLKVESGDMPDAGEYMEEFWTIYRLLGQDSVLEANFDVYNQPSKNYSEAIARFQKEVTHMGVTSNVIMIPYRTWCPLQAHMYETNFNNEQVEVYVSKLMNILLDVSFQAGVCGHAMYKNQPEQLQKYIEKVSEEITFISSFVSRWFYDSLETAWPVAHRQIVKEQMIRFNITFNDILSCVSLEVESEECTKKMGMLKMVTKPKLMSTGFPNYTYELFALVNADKIEHMICQEDEQSLCSIKKEATGLHTVIRRKIDIPEEQIEEAPSAISREAEQTAKLEKKFVDF